MKKLLLLGAVAISGLLFSQENGFKGKTFITGTIGYETIENNNSSGEQSVKTFTFQPTIGYFIANDIAIGLGIGFSNAKNTINQNYFYGTQIVNTSYTQEDSRFFIMPLIRKYWGLGDKLYFFGQFDANYGTGKSKTIMNNSTTESKTSSYGFNLRPGLDYFFNKNWSIEATIGSVGYNSYKFENNQPNDNFSLKLNLSSIGFGAKYVF